MSEFSSTGRIVNVQTKFAYIDCDRGRVFCPLSAACDQYVPSMLSKYKIGDIVHFQACTQPEKNGCSLIATRMRLSMNSYAYQGLDEQDSSRTGVIVRVTTVQETLAYAYSDEIGAVFVPGSSFASTEDNRLTTHVFPGQLLAVDVVRQSEKNECRWRAVAAIKLNTPKPFEGSGRITTLSSTRATVFSPEWGAVDCSILAWAGGVGGKGDSLLDVVSFGDEVVFEVIQTTEGASAIRWTSCQRGYVNGPRSTSESFSQTVPTVEEKFFRSAEKTKLREILESSPVIHRLLNDVNLL